MTFDYDEVKKKLREVLDAVEHDGLVLQKMLMEIFDDVTGSVVMDEDGNGFSHASGDGGTQV